MGDKNSENAWSVLTRPVNALWDLVFPPSGGPKPIEIQSLSDQFFMTLQAAFQRTSEPHSHPEKEIWKRTEELLGKGRENANWDDNYQIEQNLVDLYDEKALETELGIRVIEAASIINPALAAWYAKEQEEAGGDVATQRTLLGRLVNDLQWRYKTRESRKGYAQRISRDTAILFMAIGVLFVLALVWSVEWMSAEGGDWFCSTLLATGAGAFGAGFSMMVSMGDRLEKSGLDNLKMLGSRWVMASRVLLGAGAALILLFFMKSPLLEGAAFPSFEPEVSATRTDDPAEPDKTVFLDWDWPRYWFSPRPVENPPAKPCPLSAADLALLVAWCFLAGFSEKLVPTILANTEKRVTDVGTAPRPPA